MDAITGLLDGPRAQRAFLLRSSLAPPWSMRVADRAPLTLVAVVRGAACVQVADGGSADLGPHDVAIVRGPEAYVVADEASTRPQVEIGPDQVCRPLAVGARPYGPLGVRSWGTDLDGPTVLLTGTYPLDGAVPRRLLAALPVLAAVTATGRGAESVAPLVELMAGEIAREEPGQEAVLDRLLDLVLVASLRAWFGRADAEPPGWYAAYADPVVGPALRLLHDRPAAPWTVGALAAEVGLSRAAFARRFAEQVGQPPMAYLTDWRLTLAADLLRDPGATLATVARQVGYAGPYALSAAFSRVRGLSPREHRRAVGADAPDP